MYIKMDMSAMRVNINIKRRPSDHGMFTREMRYSNIIYKFDLNKC